MKILLSESQVSALECADISGTDPDDVIITKAWRTGRRLVFEADEREALYEWLTNQSNVDDAIAGHETDAACKRAARRASRSLATVASKVLRAT